ncbi:MAG TPA: MurR/RpiR family transcriptional regulator [Tetragenococcus sp.]|nr:MurR/RpiR family transcriptional regulator [Tetragenococcus sp.]
MNLDYLKEIYQLTTTEINILSYLEQHIPKQNHISIRQTAHDCFTSPASIVRMSKKMNLSGFSELIYKIKDAQLSAPLAKETMPDASKIEQFCRLLKQNKGALIAILGTDFSTHLGAFISDVLNFHSIPNIRTSYTQLLNNQNNQKILFIVLSHSGEETVFKKTLQLAQAKQNNVISFVGNQQSFVAKHSNLVFSTDTFSPFSTSHAQPQLFYGQTLITFEILICTYLNSNIENK